MFQCIEQATEFADKTAIVCGKDSYTYQMLIQESGLFAKHLLQEEPDLLEAPVAFMVNPGFDYVKVQWAIWRAGGIAVPLCLTYPFPSLQYVLEDTGASVIVVSPEFESIFAAYAQERGIRLLVTNQQPDLNANRVLPVIENSRRAMILYTSGTTNLPKGVVTTHANIESQVTTLIKAWDWSSADSTLCVLPLHHVHGIINVVCCSLYAGATCEFIPEFSKELIFDIFSTGRINVFMAVPTVYYKLITHWETLDEVDKTAVKSIFRHFRLMVCGSAALPVTILEKWKQISGHILLERYGMTEIGMAISNPYQGERRAGFVGLPLPGVSVRLADENYQDAPIDQPGEILIKGPNVFLEYWKKPEATRLTFTEDGWFKTGDVAIAENGYFRILGRNSVDIIKSGGYKISALEIEEVLRTHTGITDCAVVGIDNEEWGELIVAAIVVNKTIDTKELDTWLRTKMAAYKTPRKYLLVNELPRNAMGKVVKNEVKQLFV